MNSSVPQSPLASLMMSLGGSIDFSALSTSTDAGPGLSDFSSLLQGMTGEPALLSARATVSGTGLMLPAAAEGGEALPPVLPLTVSVSQINIDSEAQEPLADTELLMTQIEQPPALGVRLMPERPKLSELAQTVTDDSSSDELNELTDGDEVVIVPVAATPLPQDTVTTTAVASTPVMRSGTRERPGTEREITDGLPGAETGSAETEGLELSAGDDFRPVTLSDDGAPRPMRQDTLLSGQPGQLQPLAQPQPALTPSPVAMASVTPETAQAVSTADVSDMADLQANDSFEQKLQHQLRERLEFGQDRREWGTALGARVLTMVADNVQQARIQLDPPELGSLEIKLHIAQDQATVQVQAQNTQVKDVLESNVQRLRDALNEQGLQLAGFDVGTSAQGQQSGGQNQNGSGSGSADGWDSDADAQDAAQPVVRRADALLDTFV